MENPENNPKRPKLENSEIRGIVIENEKLIEGIKKRIEDYFLEIKEFEDILSHQSAYLEHMEMDKQMLDLQEEIMGKRDKPKYSEEEIENLKEHISILKNNIDSIKSDISEMTLDAVNIDLLNDMWKDLHESFNQLVLRIDSSQLN